MGLKKTILVGTEHEFGTGLSFPTFWELWRSLAVGLEEDTGVTGGSVCRGHRHVHQGVDGDYSSVLYLLASNAVADEPSTGHRGCSVAQL